jgi:serine/threonine-protein kinase
VTPIPPGLSAALADRYRIERELGMGGMATVFLAEDLKHHRKVAIKVLRPELAATLGATRFQQEIKIAASLQHPHILAVHDSGEAGGFLYYVMPYVEGESLRQRLDRPDRVPVAEAIRLLGEVADALAYAHANGIVHRDIKPENVMLSGRHASVMDFGVAKAISDASDGDSAATAGIALGTPVYMAPEQATADPALDGRADIYALGVLGYELLAGRPPFTEGGPQRILAAHLNQVPEPIAAMRPDVPPALANVVMRALAKTPGERWQSAEQVLEQLEPLRNASGGGITPTATQAIAFADPGLARRRRYALGGAVLLLAMVFLAALAWNRNRVAPASNVAATPAAAVVADITKDPSIAVLPFVNMSSDKDQEFFSDGISEELLNLLAKVPKLRVIARTSSFSFKGKNVAIPDIGRALNVSSILQGSVRKSGDKLRITVQLIRAADGTQVWSEAYDRQLTDIFAIQDEIAVTVVSQLKITLLGSAPKTRVVDPAAYSLFLQARAISFQNSPKTHEKAIGLFKQALAIDPGYAEAWVGLANIYCLQMGFGTQRASVGVPLAEAALENALAIDPGNAQAYALVGWVDIIKGDLAAAARDIERAYALDPTNSQVIDIAAYLARILGRLDQAIALGEYARARDPANADNLSDLAGAYQFAGRLDAAMAELGTVLSVSPNYLAAHEALGQVLLKTGDAPGALREMQLETNERRRQRGLAVIYYALGRTTDSNALLAQLMATGDAESAFAVAMVLAYRGDADGAFRWLEKFSQFPGVDYSEINLFPGLDSLHADPRWLPFLRKIRQAPEQLAKVEFKVMPPR